MLAGILIITHIVAIIIGIIICRKFSKDIALFTEKEIMVVTQKIEAYREKDLSIYRRLSEEWADILDRKSKLASTLSVELEVILKEVEAI